MKDALSLPYFVQVTISLLGLIAIIAILYIAQNIILPLVLAIIIAIALHPLVKFFVRKRINRVVSIVIVLLLTLIIVTLSGFLLYSQASRFSHSWPILADKFTLALKESIIWASGYFDINTQIIHDWMTKIKDDLINDSGSSIGQTLTLLGNSVMIMTLMPVYVFMLLFYHPHLINFIHKLFSSKHQGQVSEIVTQTKALIQHYIIGLLIEIIIVAVLFTIGLLIIGIDYAILLGFIAALLNVIPYIGSVISWTLIIIITVATKDMIIYPILVTALSIVVQFFDNNYIVPKVVASKVKINALVTIITVITAGSFFGILGMIICIPTLGILKLVFDRIESLKPWGFLLGNSIKK